MSVAFAARLIPPRPRRGSARAGLPPLAVPAGTLPGPRRRGPIRRTGATVRAVVFAVLTMLALVLGTPISTAEAVPFGLDCIGVPGKGNWGPENYASASTILLPAAQPQYGPEPKPSMDKATLAKNYTLYELTNGRGLLWSTYKKNANGDDKCSIMDVAGNWMAQTVFEFSKSLGNYSLSIQDLAMNTAPFQDLYQGKDGSANSLVAKLYQTLWAPLGTVMVILCGAWVVVHSKTKSRQKVWQGIGGMFVSLMVSALLLQGSWYTTVTSEADKMINGFTSAMTEVMLPEAIGSKTADPCWLAEGVPNRAKRISSCTMYKAMMFTPWAAGQFGANANLVIDSGWKGNSEGGWDTDDCSLGYRCTDIRTAQVMAQTYTRADNPKTLDKKGDMFDKVAKQMAKGDRKSRFNDWRGANPSSRMQVALAAGVADIVLAPSVDFAALFKLFWEGFILILIIVLPIVGAVSAFPPATFMMREWGNAFTISFILKGIAWLALTLLMVLYVMILSSTASLGVQVLMIILLGFGLFHFTRKTMQGAKRSADQAFEAKAAYTDVTSRAGYYAKSTAQQAARRGFQQITGNRMPVPKGAKGPKSPSPTGGPNGSRPNGTPPANRQQASGSSAAASSGRTQPATGATGRTTTATNSRGKPTPVGGRPSTDPASTTGNGASSATATGKGTSSTTAGTPPAGASGTDPVPLTRAPSPKRQVIELDPEPRPKPPRRQAIELDPEPQPGGSPGPGPVSRGPAAFAPQPLPSRRPRPELRPSYNPPSEKDPAFRRQPSDSGPPPSPPRLAPPAPPAPESDS
ncbi:hypothetical protein ABZ502_17795 [Streptomyces abikoensis]|uniref:hypothetical protein n=1 Tax=Streptomyces abikoensis TaxID=97398 RepID=UPI0033F1B3E9